MVKMTQLYNIYPKYPLQGPVLAAQLQKLILFVHSEFLNLHCFVSLYIHGQIDQSSNFCVCKLACFQLKQFGNSKTLLYEGRSLCQKFFQLLLAAV